MKYKYRVIGYQKEEKLARQFISAVSIWVVAENSGEAIDKAKKMIKKRHYRVSEAQEIIKDSPLEEYNIQNLLYQKYRKKIDVKMLKNSEELNKTLEKIAKSIELIKLKQ